MAGTATVQSVVLMLSAGLGSNRKLARLDGLIDRAPFARLASGVRAGRRGRPPYAPLSMLKAL